MGTWPCHEVRGWFGLSPGRLRVFSWSVSHMRAVQLTFSMTGRSIYQSRSRSVRFSFQAVRGESKSPPLRSSPAIVPPLTKALLPHLGSRFALFGHSMGALISFEVIRELRRVHRLKALHLFVSGCYAPHIPDPNPLYPLPDHQFIEELKRLQGVPPAELDNSELVQLMLPTLRADCLVTETYSHQEDLPLDCPIIGHASVMLVLGGPVTEDKVYGRWPGLGARATLRGPRSAGDDRLPPGNRRSRIEAPGQPESRTGFPRLRQPAHETLTSSVTPVSCRLWRMRLAPVSV